jgi:hypothetical protein
MARPLALCLLLLAVSCGSDKTPPPAAEDVGQPAGPTVAVRPVDLEQVEYTDLIYWDNLFTLGAQAAPPDLQRVVEALAASPDPAHQPFLVDLSFYPTPYHETAVAALLGRKGAWTISDILEAVQKRGFKRPEDDPPSYLAFKRALISTIQQEIGAFLDARLPRNISAQEVFWGGVCVDCIPPLEEPRFVSAAAAASWILPSDLVIGVEVNGDVRAYPRRIIDWHEMVNDTVGGIPVSLAYCTLCGSAILYDGRFGDQVFRFGTSGLLYRSNKLMYDRNTRSLWEQFTGEPAWGVLVGQGIRLRTLPVVHTSWQEWLSRHPDTRVLDIDTGFRRDYGSGVAYRDYWASADLIFPAPNRDGPLSSKVWVYAVRTGAGLSAYPISLLARRGLIEDRDGEVAIVVVATPDGSGGRAYERDGLSFGVVDLAAGILLGSDGQTWRLSETALLAEDGRRLPRLPGHNSFWFAVINHAPVWRLYQE